MTESFTERLAHPCFPQPAAELSVWRYMTLAKLVSLLQTGSLYLSRLDLLSDLHEGAVPRLLIEERDKALGLSKNPELRKLVDGVHQRIRSSLFVSCWALNDHESEALWRIFARDGDGVAIHANYQVLVDTIEPDDNLYVGQVKYIDYEKEYFPDDNVFYAVMHKRLAFAHEREVRVVRLKNEYLDQNSKLLPPPGISVPVDIGKLIRALYISPYCPEWYADAVRAIIEKFAPYLSDRVRWSPMRVTPHF